jgi:hypothetical protein
MDQKFVERRRLLQWFALGSLAAPVAALAGCAARGGTRPPDFRTGGGNRGGEKSKGGGSN